MPGDLFILGIARKPAAHYVPEVGTLLLAQPPPVPVVVGALPPSGELLLSYPIGEWTSGVEVFYGQACFIVSGSDILSSGSAIVVLHAGI